LNDENEVFFSRMKNAVRRNDELLSQIGFDPYIHERVGTKMAFRIGNQRPHPGGPGLRIDHRTDAGDPPFESLSSQRGGRHFDLLAFLDLRKLVLEDLGVNPDVSFGEQKAHRGNLARGESSYLG